MINKTHKAKPINHKRNGTFSQIYIQYVFAVKHRQNLLHKDWRSTVFEYMAGTIRGKNQKPIIVNGVEDHVHVFVGIKPSVCIADLVRDIKNNSSKFINEQGYLNHPFSWQEGYGAFSYSHSSIKNVFRYIENQEVHHQKKSFRQEYLNFLKQFDIEYDEQYLFDWIL
jgi:REP element-mobilizing transposase RayT